MRFPTCFLLVIAALWTAAAPAEARLGDSVTVAREMARRHGAKSVRVYTDHPYPTDDRARVVAVTWIAPDDGWTLEEANGFLKLIVGHKRRIMVKTSRAEIGYVYTFRYQDEIGARCVYEQNRVREITATAPTFAEADASEAKSTTFVFPMSP